VHDWGGLCKFAIGKTF